MAALHSPEDVNSLDPSERTDFSIFLRYPDIDFDPEARHMDGPGPAFVYSSPVPQVAENLRPTEAFSSPESDQHHNDDTDLASRSASTPHTTPSPLGVQGRKSVQSTQADEYQEFLYTLASSDLPETAVYYYRSLADQMLQISAFLQPKTFYLSTTTSQDVLGCSDCLLTQLQASAKTVKGQISAIHYITSLAPFTVTPTDFALQSILHQRTSLIVAHLTLPSRRSFSLLSALLTVFDAYIYSPYLYLSRHRDNFSAACAERINALYNELQTLITSYGAWLRTLRDLKSRYMAPLLRQISDSATVQTEISQREAALLACDEMNKRPLSDIMADKVEDEQVRGAERLAERRRTKSSTLVRERRRRMIVARGTGGLQGMIRTRARRENTL